ncbi:hypothetical protein RHGRI_027550 [Rhododendron griersonianum]|uniref:UBC core domain-containing protein n=1 Tax=Rhododendron griersonianum TaxID=479676 RepID=A0AAV6J206_9ERIC|nr:hypothetical protein RHGRI_027550 [Rhododendron griersonianum]
MASTSQASLLLQKQLKDLCKHPVDGFSAGLVDESNLFEWSVMITGPPDTLYEGGFFNAVMTFPSNYPNSPPTVRFTSDIWHPNVGKENGKDECAFTVGPDKLVESIVLSIISMLSSPNDESPANVEAAVSVHSLCFLSAFLPFSSLGVVTVFKKNGEIEGMISRRKSVDALESRKRCCDAASAPLSPTFVMTKRQLCFNACNGSVAVDQTIYSVIYVEFRKIIILHPLSMFLLDIQISDI